ncbi:MAG: hypothetical protein H7Y00_02500 [Fimbriimonadaceae bacterium]|nr:hypothetical protein [Chitinophagales bacterium]
MKILTILSISALLTGCVATEIPIITDTPEETTVFENGSIECPGGGYSFYWYINGDKSTKLKDVIIGGHIIQFPDSIATVYLWEYIEGKGSHEEQMPVVEIRDPLHTCNSVNKILYDLGYIEYDRFWLEFYNSNGEYVPLPEFEQIYDLIN